MADFKPDPGWVEIPAGHLIEWGTVRNNPGASDHMIFDPEDSNHAAVEMEKASAGKRILATRQTFVSARARWS